MLGKNGNSGGDFQFLLRFPCCLWIPTAFLSPPPPHSFMCGFVLADFVLPVGILCCCCAISGQSTFKEVRRRTWRASIEGVET